MLKNLILQKHFTCIYSANWQVKQLSTLQQWKQWAFREIRTKDRNLHRCFYLQQMTWHSCWGPRETTTPSIEYWIDVFVLLPVIFSASDTWGKKPYSLTLTLCETESLLSGWGTMHVPFRHCCCQQVETLLSCSEQKFSNRPWAFVLQRSNFETLIY